MPFQIESVGITDVGVQRSHNEDTLLVEPSTGLYVVCDGMGGHASGAVASQLAVATIAEAIRTGNPPSMPGVDPLVTAILTSNATVYGQSLSDPQCHGMGTTVVAIRQQNDIVHVCHVGDSRIYMLRGAELHQITRDHSLINLYEDNPELVGKLGPAHSNIIVRAIGLREHVEVDHRMVSLENGDMFLLCSDGLVDMVDDWMLREMMTSGDDLVTIAQNMIRAANVNGGSDNISVLILRAHEY
jgi:serine/threonine protein phosphatase PrpC